MSHFVVGCRESHCFTHLVFDGDSKILRTLPLPLAILVTSIVVPVALSCCKHTLTHQPLHCLHMPHVLICFLLCADMQERLLAETSRNGESSWRKNYYMPAQADRCVHSLLAVSAPQGFVTMSKFSIASPAGVCR